MWNDMLCLCVLSQDFFMEDDDDVGNDNEEDVQSMQLFSAGDKDRIFMPVLTVTS